MKSVFFVTTLLGAGLASAASCPAPGDMDREGRYSCNPAATYPSGELCQQVDDCFFLVDVFEKPIIGKPVKGAPILPRGKSPVTSHATTLPTSTPACPAPGNYDSKGRYSCNPAHQYPEKQTCAMVDGCPFLVGADGKPVISKPTATGTGAALPTGTGVCPAPGAYDYEGRYACSPTHEYPKNQTCGIYNGCYFFVGPDGKPLHPSGTRPPVPTGTSGATAMGMGGGVGMLALAAAAAALL
ncbi:hypothetical protein E4U53_003076 [Claviceps sorghi]|nr:hypothetical protein E4U53_003076 [Claviceps sorghi]